MFANFLPLDARVKNFTRGLCCRIVYPAPESPPSFLMQADGRTDRRTAGMSYIPAASRPHDLTAFLDCGGETSLADIITGWQEGRRERDQRRRGPSVRRFLSPSLHSCSSTHSPCFVMLFCVSCGACLVAMVSAQQPGEFAKIL